MRVLPVVERELRVASRRYGTYWNRTVAALVAMLVVAWVLLVIDRGTASVGGRQLFQTLAWIAFFYGLFSGFGHTTDSVSEEKREGTLGLLFLTNLKGFDVVFGKLAATSLKAVYSMVAILPVMAIPLLLGGVGRDEFWRMVLVLMNTMFLSLAAGMFFSVVCRSSRGALVMSLVFLLAIHLTLPIWLATHPGARFTNPDPWVQCLLAINPVVNLVFSFEREFGRAPVNYWMPLITLGALGWLMLLAASWIVGRVWQDRPAGAGVLSLKQRAQVWTQGSRSLRAGLRTAMLDVNPMVWLSGRNRFRTDLLWIVLTLLGCVWVWGAFRYGRDWTEPAVYFVTALVLTWVIKFWVASESVRRFHEDRQSGALELLLCTPLRLRDIFGGHLLGMKRLFFGPVVAVLVADVSCLFLSLENIAGTRDRSLWFWMFVAGMTVAVADLVTMVWLGMWLGLNRRQANRAVAGVISGVMGVPWLIFIGFLMILLMPGLQRSAPNSPFFYLGLWFVISLVNDGCLLLWSRLRLYEDFRNLAHMRASQGGHLKIWRWLGRAWGRARYAPPAPKGHGTV